MSHNFLSYYYRQLAGGSLITSRWAVWIPRWASVLFVAGGCLSLGGPQPSVPPERAVVNQYCVGCHNGKVNAGALALDTIAAENVSQRTDVWEKVVRKLRARYMPPAGVPRP